MMRRLVPFSQADSALSHDRPRPERLVRGNPVRTTWEHYANPTAKSRAACGPARSAHGRIAFDESSDEYFHVLEGRIRITDDAGDSCEFGPERGLRDPSGICRRVSRFWNP